MSIRMCMYFRDVEELEQTKVFLCALRGKRAGLSDGQVRKAVEMGLGNAKVAAVVDDNVCGEQVDDRGWLIMPKNDTPSPVGYWLTRVDRLWRAGLPQDLCEKLNDIPHADTNEELKKYGYVYEDDTLYYILNKGADQNTSALPSKEERTIPTQLKKFIDAGWDLETAFRIYDEWDSDMHNITEHSDSVKSLNQRFMEERMKRDANEGAE